MVQSPRARYQKLNNEVTSKEVGYKRSESNDCLYLLQELVSILTLYVDDVLMCSKNESVDARVLAKLKNLFTIKDLGRPSLYLGMNVEYDENAERIKISHQRLIADLLERMGMSECKPIASPLGGEPKMEEPTDEPITEEKEVKAYRSTVGTLMYISLTRPDILYAASFLARFLQNPIQRMWILAKRFVCYLEGTDSKGLVFHRNATYELCLEGCADASFANDEMIDDIFTKGLAKPQHLRCMNKLVS